MGSIVLVRSQTGQLEGLGDKNQRTYARFLKACRELTPGETISFTYRVPRSPRFHRLHFAMLNLLFESQEQFDDPDHFRKWLEVGAGHCELLPGQDGQLVAIPKSIAYHALDDEEFHAVHTSVKRFLRGQYCQSHLWPHLNPKNRADMVEQLLEEFEVNEWRG